MNTILIDNPFVSSQRSPNACSLWISLGPEDEYEFFVSQFFPDTICLHYFHFHACNVLEMWCEERLICKESKSYNSKRYFNIKNIGYRSNRQEATARIRSYHNLLIINQKICKLSVYHGFASLRMH